MFVNCVYNSLCQFTWYLFDSDTTHQCERNVGSMVLSVIYGHTGANKLPTPFWKYRVEATGESTEEIRLEEKQSRNPEANNQKEEKDSRGSSYKKKTLTKTKMDLLLLFSTGVARQNTIVQVEISTHSHDTVSFDMTLLTSYLCVIVSTYWQERGHLRIFFTGRK